MKYFIACDQCLPAENISIKNIGKIAFRMLVNRNLLGFYKKNKYV